VWAWQHGPWNLQSTLPFLFLWFAAGMILAVLSARFDDRENEAGFTRFIEAHGDVIFVGSLVLYAVMSYSPAFPRGVERSYTITTYMLEHLLYAAVSFGLLLPAVFGESSGGQARRLLRSRVLDYLGRISYGIFLWHHTIMLVIWARLPLREWPVGPFWSLFALTLAASVIVAAASHAWIEAPFMKLRRTR
jgi:peptidoglycan/LPS O-acetylase OafA/YrhL